MPGIQQITHDLAGNAFWAGNALYVSGTASQASGAAAVTIADLLAGAKPGDVSAIIDAKAMTVVVYNNATAQTITGLSLKASGSTTSGGTGTITYPITADVTGAAISIASGLTQTFLVPLIKGVLRTWTLTPTFGAAPAAGSVDTMTTVHGAGAAVTSPGSVLQQNASVSYTSLDTASTTYYFTFPILTRNARARRVIANGPQGSSAFTPLNQYVSVSVGVLDSTAVNTLPSDIRNLIANLVTSAVANVGLSAGYIADWTSAAYPLLAGLGDTLLVEVTTGTTAPTAGELPLYALEVL